MSLRNKILSMPLNARIKKYGIDWSMRTAGGGSFNKHSSNREEVNQLITNDLVSQQDTAYDFSKDITYKPSEDEKQT